MPALRFGTAILVSVLTIGTHSAQPAPLTGKPARVDRFGDALPPGALFRIGTTRLQLDRQLQAIAASPDGKLVAAVSDDQLGIWEVPSGREVTRFPHKGQGTSWIAFSPDSGAVASNEDGLTVEILDRKSGLVRRGPLGAALAGAFAADGKTLFVVQRSADQQSLTITRKDLASGKPVKEWLVELDPTKSDEKRPFSSFELAIAPDGKTLAILNGYGRKAKALVRLVDLNTGAVVRRTSFDPMIRNLVFSPDSKFFAVTYNDGMGGTPSSVHIWNIATDQEKATLKPSSRGAPSIAAIAFAPDGQSIFGSEHAGLVRWDWQSGKRLQVYPGAGGPIAFFPDGKTMAVQGWIGSVRLLNIETGKDLCPLPRAGKHVAFDSHDQRVAWCEGSEIVLAGMPTGKEVRRWQAHEHFAGPLAFAPDGKLLASAGTDYRTRLWELPAGKEIHNLGEDGGQHGLHFSEDGRRLATQGPNRTHVWDVASGKQTAWWPGGESAAIAANLSVAAVPNRQAQTIRLIDPATGKTRHTLSGFQRDLDIRVTRQPWFAPLLSPDGRLVLAPGAAAGQRSATELWLWDVTSGKRMPAVVSLKTVRPENFVFSPDGRLLAALRTGGKISLLSTATAETVRLLGISEFPWHAPPAFTPDGRILIGGDKGRLRFWEIATGGEIVRRVAHQSHVRELVVSADGRAVASVSLDHTTLVWDMTRLVTEAGSPASTGAELDTVWKDLAHPDAAKGRHAIETLIAAPKQAASLLRERLMPAPKLDAKKLARWVADLGSDAFERREEAEEELDRLGARAGPALRQALAGDVPLEARRRIEQLLAKLDRPAALTGEPLRMVRAVQVLEGVGDPGALLMLRELAQGGAGALLTDEAAAAVRRMEQVAKQSGS